MHRMFKNQLNARSFFADKVIQRADVEGAPLSDGERQMLFWSESESDSAADPVLVERLAASISDAHYETRSLGY
jgi:hypothetical protein